MSLKMFARTLWQSDTEKQVLPEVESGTEKAQVAESNYTESSSHFTELRERINLCDSCWTRSGQNLNIFNCGWIISIFPS